MVCCDGCDRWSHMGCVGIMTQQQIPDSTLPWFCFECLHKHGVLSPKPRPKPKPAARSPVKSYHPAPARVGLTLAELAKPTRRMIAAAQQKKQLSSTRGAAPSIPVSAKVRGVRAPATMGAEVGDQIDVCDDFFQWYPSRVLEVADGMAFVRFGEYPARFNSWVPVHCGRMAQLNTFTEGRPDDCKTVGTTANIASGTMIRVHMPKGKDVWKVCKVEATSPDGESVCVVTDCVPEGGLWVDIRSGNVTVYIPEQPKTETKAKFKWGTVSTDAAAAGYHAFIVRNTRFEVASNYVQPRFIGMGAYGCVCLAEDTSLGGNVAIKKVFDLQSMDEEDLGRTLREIKVLRHLRGHPHIIHLQQVFPPYSTESMNELYLVLKSFPDEALASDLKRFIKLNKLISTETVCSFMKQIASALLCIHSAGIVHRDITPSNILVGPNGVVKVCDFGLSASFVKFKPEGMHTYVVMRWYRAPELLCGFPRYGPAIDIWSAGCVLAELMSRKPLFPGKSTKDQLKIIVKAVGKPKGAALKEFLRGCTEAQRLKDLPEAQPKPLEQVVSGEHDHELMDLLGQTLGFDPCDRISAQDALEHPALKEVRLPEGEHEGSKGEFDFTNDDLSIDELHKLLHEEVTKELD
eukprot:TRINITY_DN12440_c0_g1_i1.p1 TRINITY_DN12440_c0_g1~~TRINITY_DN12440_c0_g1_i1.p1  ORF type:complete len:632 (+),score=153.76 TRINITY_DN12440_c0_g1_i1:674-2569(+)